MVTYILRSARLLFIGLVVRLTGRADLQFLQVDGPPGRAPE